MRLLPTLAFSYPLPGGMPVVSPDIARKFCIVKKSAARRRSYFEYVLTDGARQWHGASRRFSGGPSQPQ
eukprot:1585719-Pyramimonas_sp.AAC.1